MGEINKSERNMDMLRNMMERSVPVKDAMTVNVYVANLDDPVMEVANTMVNKGIGSMVIKENDEPVGIICERDLLEKVISSDQKPSDVKAKDIMEEPLITTSSNTDMLDAMRIMIKNDIGHLPVVDDGELTGIVTVQDALEVTPQILEIIPEREEIQPEGRKEDVKESVCEICGETGKPLIQYKNKWICDECRDFLVG